MFLPQSPAKELNSLLLHIEQTVRVSRTQSVRAAVSDASLALTCTDVPKLIQLYHYFTAPALSDLAARYHLQTSTRLSSLISIIAEHQCVSACPGYNNIFIFHRLKRPQT